MEKKTKKEKAQDINSISAKMYEISELLEKGQIEVQGEILIFPTEFITKLEAKYDALESEIKKSE